MGDEADEQVRHSFHSTRLSCRFLTFYRRKSQETSAPRLVHKLTKITTWTKNMTTITLIITSTTAKGTIWMMEAVVVGGD